MKSAASEKIMEAGPVSEADPIDPFRAELGATIADRSAREADVAAAKQVVARLTSAVEKAEKRRSFASTKAEFECTDLVEHMVETAKNRTVESTPASSARRDLALATEEVGVAQAALELALSRRSKADEALATATVAVERSISKLICRDLLKHIKQAEKLHDAFMAASNVIDEIVKTNEAELPEEVARKLRLMRLERQNLQFFNHEEVFGPARAWEAARKALKDDANASLPT